MTGSELTAPAAEIREAAGRIRDKHTPGPPEQVLAVVADWLDKVAGDAQAAFQVGDRLNTHWCDEPAAVESALTIARAFPAVYAEPLTVPPSRQTSAPVERMSLNATNRLASELARLYEDGRLTADLPYQRGSIWTEDQRIALVYSWLSGTPIPSVILNDRMTAEWTELHGEFRRGTALWAVIDGKQRIETAAAWFGGRLAVPASWFPAVRIAVTEDTADGPYVRFTGLTAAGQRVFENRALLPAATASAATIEEEAGIYLRVNGGGTAQDAADMHRAARIARTGEQP